MYTCMSHDSSHMYMQEVGRPIASYPGLGTRLSGPRDAAPETRTHAGTTDTSDVSYSWP